MIPVLQIDSLKAIIRSGTGESQCEVMQRIAGEGRATYYTNPSIVDLSVSPHLNDGDYQFRYVDESNDWATVTRNDGAWLNVPASSKSPKV